MQILKYACSHNKWSKYKKNWKNNCSRIFVIVLQHYPNDLVQRLKSKDQWPAANLAKNVITLTRMIFYGAYAHNDTTQGMMAIVTSNMVMYTTYMSKAEKPIDFAHTFQANVNKTITHGGCAGCHPQLFLRSK